MIRAYHESFCKYFYDVCFSFLSMLGFFYRDFLSWLNWNFKVLVIFCKYFFVKFKCFFFSFCAFVFLIIHFREWKFFQEFEFQLAVLTWVEERIFFLLLLLLIIFKCVNKCVLYCYTLQNIIDIQEINIPNHSDKLLINSH